ncbi:MAG TPA: glycerate-2-kinase family protein, partial [Vicinamibacterales bacterium]|nr:glycerate-2-kinase family protein [Vicinamibacterales bacterium]
MHERQRRPASQFHPQEIRCRHQPVSLVRSKALALTPSSPHTELRPVLARIIDGALRACDPAALVRAALITGPFGSSIWLLAAGKASAGMARAAVDVLGARVKGGLVIAPGATPIRSPIPPLEFVSGGHPVPTAESERAGRRALALAHQTTRNDTFLVLLSGGASALMAVPVPPLTLEDKQRTTEVLLRNGADIHALNTVRKHLSAIKGG